MLRYFHTKPSQGATASGYIVLDPSTQLRALSERAFALLTDKHSYNLVAETPVSSRAGETPCVLSVSSGGGCGSTGWRHDLSALTWPFSDLLRGFQEIARMWRAKLALAATQAKAVSLDISHA